MKVGDPRSRIEVALIATAVLLAIGLPLIGLVQMVRRTRRRRLQCKTDVSLLDLIGRGS
jgi:hypothetical protein